MLLKWMLGLIKVCVWWCNTLMFFKLRHASLWVRSSFHLCLLKKLQVFGRVNLMTHLAMSCCMIPLLSTCRSQPWVRKWDWLGRQVEWRYHSSVCKGTILLRSFPTSHVFKELSMFLGYLCHWILCGFLNKSRRFRIVSLLMSLNAGPLGVYNNLGLLLF